MKQSRLSSLVESLMNITIGYGVALASQLIIFEQLDIHVSFETNLWLGVWFTLISLIRSYIIRRWFNARLHNAAERLTQAKRITL